MIAKESIGGMDATGIVRASAECRRRVGLTVFSKI